MQIRTGFQGSSVKFSPYEDGRIAVGTAQNFGIIGNGKQHVFQVSPISCSDARCCSKSYQALLWVIHRCVSGQA